MKKTSLIIVLVLLCNFLSGQNESSDSEFEQKSAEPLEIEFKADIGFGFGLDYGGLIGVKAMYVPFKYIGVFGAIGYQLVAMGWNVGMHIYILPKTNLHRVRPYVKIMYGTNRAIKVEGASEYDAVYKGLTPGAGVELRFGAKASHGLTLNLNFPISSEEFQDDWDKVKKDPRVEVIQDVLPFAISIGYHFEF